MGEILCTKRHESGKVVVELLLRPEEYRQLRGEMDNIYLFTDKAAATPSKVSLRGRNEATQYFLVPRQLRRHVPVHGAVSCQRIEYEGKLVFVYVVDPYKRGSNIAL